MHIMYLHLTILVAILLILLSASYARGGAYLRDTTVHAHNVLVLHGPILILLSASAFLKSAYLMNTCSVITKLLTWATLRSWSAGHLCILCVYCAVSSFNSALL